MINTDFAVIIPMANEEKEFFAFTSELIETLDNLRSGKVYFIVDKVSKDNTLQLCKDLEKKDSRFECIWAPENKNVVDAYITGYKRAFDNKHPIIIEMDAGLSHNPKTLPKFINLLANDEVECAFGSRFIQGGEIKNSNWKRSFLSKSGTFLANFLLGTNLKDMTSGYQGFQSHVVEKFLDYQLLSKAHFYQTELRYLLRNFKAVEIPIQYQAPSPSVSKKAIKNSFEVLFYYLKNRILNNSKVIK